MRYLMAALRAFAFLSVPMLSDNALAAKKSMTTSEAKQPYVNCVPAGSMSKKRARHRHAALLIRKARFRSGTLGGPRPILPARRIAA